MGLGCELLSFVWSPKLCSLAAFSKMDLLSTGELSFSKDSYNSHNYDSTCKHSFLYKNSNKAGYKVRLIQMFADRCIKC